MGRKGRGRWKGRKKERWIEGREGGGNEGKREVEMEEEKEVDRR